jgi:hypothetical protein
LHFRNTMKQCIQAPWKDNYTHFILWITCKTNIYNRTFCQRLKQVFYFLQQGSVREHVNSLEDESFCGCWKTGSSTTQTPEGELKLVVCFPSQRSKDRSCRTLFGWSSRKDKIVFWAPKMSPWPCWYRFSNSWAVGLVSWQCLFLMGSSGGTRDPSGLRGGTSDVPVRTLVWVESPMPLVKWLGVGLELPTLGMDVRWGRLREVKNETNH